MNCTINSVFLLIFNNFLFLTSGDFFLIRCKVGKQYVCYEHFKNKTDFGVLNIIFNIAYKIPLGLQTINYTFNEHYSLKESSIKSNVNYKN